MPARRAILWFRRDLRLADHPALAAAASDGVVVPLFVADPQILRRAGAPRRAYLARALASLDGDLQGTLVVRSGDPAVEVPRLAEEVGARTVVVTTDYGPAGRPRDVAVARALAAVGRHLRGVGSPYLVPPGEVTTGGTSATSGRRTWCPPVR